MNGWHEAFSIHRTLQFHVTMTKKALSAPFLVLSGQGQRGGLAAPLVSASLDQGCTSGRAQGDLASLIPNISQFLLLLLF